MHRPSLRYFRRGNILARNGRKLCKDNSTARQTKMVPRMMSSSSSLIHKIPHQGFIYSDEVAHALDNHYPVVALESTIISHGMPWPDNLTCAMEVEDIVRAKGATPATIAIIHGVPRIGLSASELKMFAKLPQESVRKCSRRDLAVSMGFREHGATTVAATMMLANLAGISVFVTGGIGGVHRGAIDGENPSLDISADLSELGRTNVAVVCAGVKSILDVPRTLEYLETMGVSVLTLGQEEFPSFFTKDSGMKSPVSVKDVIEAARVLHASTSVLELDSGMLLAVPNPEPLDQALHDKCIVEALEEAAQAGITGKESTPFLLKRVNELSGGSSLTANVALVKNNAAVGASLAVHLERLRQTQGVTVRVNSRRRRVDDLVLDLADPDSKLPSAAASSSSTSSSSPQLAAIAVPLRSESTFARKEDRKSILVVGGAAVDFNARPFEGPNFHTSNPGIINESMGGVGRNIAEAITNLNAWHQYCQAMESKEHVGESKQEGNGQSEALTVDVSLLTAVGDDHRGRSILAHCADKGIDTSMVKAFANERTPTYCSVASQGGDLLIAVADMEIFDHLSSFEFSKGELERFALIIVDGNMPASLIERVSSDALDSGVPVMFEPVSVSKAVKGSSCLQSMFVVTPNRDEVTAIADALKGDKRYAGGSYQEDAFVVARAMHVPGKTRYVFVTLGEDGVFAVCSHPDGRITDAVYDAVPVPPNDIISTNGAGDTFSGALAYYMVQQLHKQGPDLEQGDDISSCLAKAMPEIVEQSMRASARALRIAEAVPTEFDDDM